MNNILSTVAQHMPQATAFWSCGFGRGNSIPGSQGSDGDKV